MTGLALRERLVEASRTLASAWLGLALGVAGALVVALVVAAGPLSLVWVGLPLLLGAMAAARRLAELERRQANLFLGAQIAPLPRRARGRDGMWRRAVDALGDRWHWRLLVLMALRLPVAVLALLIAIVPILLCAELVVLGLRGVGGLDDGTTYVGPMTLGIPAGLLLLALAVPTAVVAIAALDGLRGLMRGLARFALAPRAETEGPVRETLAARLGDRSVNIAYWLPDRGQFVDEAGRRVELPEPGSGRAWTAVDDAEGRRVAAIVHDASLETGRELVEAAAAGAALAIDNERLRADLRARVEDLRVSRVRIVESALEARRRIERDLHDGAQQHLVSLAIQMGMLKGRLKADTENLPLVEDMAGKLQSALEDLRELARGIHPAILTERGVGPAVEALATRSPVPVEARVELGEGRLSAPIEAAAYFVAAEGLTNVAKYSEATHAKVTIVREGDEVTVEVADDGIGGARPGEGSGLRGLADRVGALDGTLRVESPAGGGTRLVATLPCGAGTLVAEAFDSEAGA